MAFDRRPREGFRYALGHGSIVTLGRMVGALAFNKVVAFWGGPTALAITGQLQNFVTAGSALTGAAISNGTTTIAASQREDEQRQTLRESKRLALQGGAILLPLLLLAPLVLQELLPSLGSSVLLTLLLALAIWGTGQLQLALALLNAQRRLASWSSLQLIAVLLQPIAMLLGFLLGDIKLALNLFLLSNILPLALLLLRRWQLFAASVSGEQPERNRAARKRLLGFGIVQGISMLLGPLSLIWIRQLLVGNLGWEAAGQWQAIWKLSEISIALLATTLTAHLLPTMAKTALPHARLQLLHKTLFRVASLTALISGLLMVSRKWVLALAFDASFVAAAPAMGWQLLGDLFRVANWSLGLTLVARERLALYAVSEVVSVMVVMGAATVLIPIWGIEGATLAYLFENLLLFALLYTMARRAIR